MPSNRIKIDPRGLAKEYLLPPHKNILSVSALNQFYLEVVFNALMNCGYGDGFDPMIFVEDCCSNNDGDETLVDRHTCWYQFK